jgi:putative Holliday junction resolvase
MSYLAIDLWDKRCGIATSNEGIAFPKDILKRTEIITWLKKYFQKNKNITHIIVGLPYDLYGMDTRQLDKTQKFIGKLSDIFPHISILWHDERFSSFQASQGFNDHRDDIAAQCILQSYLDSISFKK